jgi:hypothetical protein
MNAPPCYLSTDLYRQDAAESGAPLVYRNSYIGVKLYAHGAHVSRRARRTAQEPPNGRSMKVASSSLIFLPAVSFIFFSLIGQVHGSRRCDHWCDQYSCEKEQCSDCPVCKVQANYCAPWCNVYTCPVQYCDGCCVCESLKAEAHCEPWCNSFTCWVRGGYCSGCASCGGDVATTNRLK